MQDDVVARSEAYLAEVVERTGVELGPKPERVDESYADERIREKIARFAERPQAGLWSVNEVLKKHDVPPEMRLHLVTAIAHLGRISNDTLEARRARSGADERAW